MVQETAVKNDAEKDPYAGRDPKFIEIGGRLGGLYLARRAPAPGEPKFVMEFTVDELTMLLLGLSKVLPEGRKLVDQTGELDDEDIDFVHALGDSVRELLIRATGAGHNHAWHGLVGGLADDATVAELAITAYANEIATERPDEVDALEVSKDGCPDKNASGVTLDAGGVTAPACVVIIDT